MNTGAIASGIVAFLSSMVAFPLVIPWLRRLHVEQQIHYEYLPESHRKKAGTPTLGGAIFVIAVPLMWVAFDRSMAGLLIVAALAGGGAIGLADDLANIRKRGNLGLYPRQKLLLQMILGVALGWAAYAYGAADQLVPLIGTVHMGWTIIPLVAIAVTSMSNAVNISDGVDGLAASCSAVSILFLLAYAIAVGATVTMPVIAALLGVVMAFLVYNWHPARLFMGDTGALGVGCAMVMAATLLHVAWLLPLIGIIFVIEIASTIINVTAIRRFGRRVFLRSPLHHHFEALGFRETPITLLFTIINGAGVLLATVILWKFP